MWIECLQRGDPGPGPHWKKKVDGVTAVVVAAAAGEVKKMMTWRRENDRTGGDKREWKVSHYSFPFFSWVGWTDERKGRGENEDGRKKETRFWVRVLGGLVSCLFLNFNTIINI